MPDDDVRTISVEPVRGPWTCPACRGELYPGTDHWCEGSLSYGLGSSQRVRFVIPQDKIPKVSGDA